MHKSAWPGSKIQEWQEAYARLRHVLPAKFRLPHMKFDAFTNRAVYSREDLRRFWANTMEQLRGLRLWNIRPWKLATNLVKDFFLTTSFAASYKAANRAE
jgi:hypothetical protein